MGKLKNIYEYENFPCLTVQDPVNEMMQGYKFGGVLFILGKDLGGGEKRLYATTIKNVIDSPRTKVNSSPGSPAKMAILGDDFYRIEMDPPGSFKPLKMSGGLKAIGALSNKIALNSKKTPYHWISANYQTVGQAILGMKDLLMSIPSIRWKG